MVRRTDEGNSYELEALNTTARNSIDRSKSKVWEPSGVKTWRLPFIGARVAGATSSRPRTGNSLFQMADSIRTYTEQLHTELRAKLDEALSNAVDFLISGSNGAGPGEQRPKRLSTKARKPSADLKPSDNVSAAGLALPIIPFCDGIPNCLRLENNQRAAAGREMSL